MITTTIQRTSGLVKKDQAFSKCLLHTEANWIQVFSTWSSSMAFFFPHCKAELQEYQMIVVDLFQAAPVNPLVTISFDVQVQDKYSKKPFHLDDWVQLNSTLLAQMLLPSSLNSACSNKQVPLSQSSGSGGNQKHADVPCWNWSFGMCKSKICPNFQSMVFSYFAGKDTRQETMNNVLPCSSLNPES